MRFTRIKKGANTDYYLLRDNNTPTVIAEVCFLSNPSEAAMITEETIQEKAAFQIAMGIMQFLHSPAFNPQEQTKYQIDSVLHLINITCHSCHKS